MDVTRAINLAISLEQEHRCSRDAAVIAAFHAVLSDALNQYMHRAHPIQAPAPVASTPELAPAQAPVQPTTQPAPTPPAPAPVPDPTPEVFQVTLDELRKIVQTASQAGHKDGIKGILASYNVAKLPDLNPATYSEVAEKVQALHAR